MSDATDLLELRPGHKWPSARRLLVVLRALARHDVAADRREGLEHCIELDDALDLLRAAGIHLTAP
jgi:hypothetical protein